MDSPLHLWPPKLWLRGAHHCHSRPRPACADRLTPTREVTLKWHGPDGRDDFSMYRRNGKTERMGLAVGRKQIAVCVGVINLSSCVTLTNKASAYPKKPFINDDRRKRHGTVTHLKCQPWLCGANRLTVVHQLLPQGYQSASLFSLLVIIHTIFFSQD